ncbi:MAG TPA: single-stranded DNA-binding protein [Mycobacteriales bacterium]|nr:single-stranded DNA-binding protein [Mycobacteriales bacterium]
MSAYVTIEGNLTADPELRYLADGTPVCRLRVAVNTRRKTSTGGYTDTEAEFYDVTVWGQAAPNAAETLSKGAAVVAAGPTWTEAYADRNGDKRTKRVIRVQHLAASLRYATATLTRNTTRQQEHQTDDIDQ